MIQFFLIKKSLKFLNKNDSSKFRMNQIKKFELFSLKHFLATNSFAV